QTGGGADRAGRVLRARELVPDPGDLPVLRGRRGLPGRAARGGTPILRHGPQSHPLHQLQRHGPGDRQHRRGRRQRRPLRERGLLLRADVHAVPLRRGREVLMRAPAVRDSRGHDSDEEPTMTMPKDGRAPRRAGAGTMGTARAGAGTLSATLVGALLLAACDGLFDAENPGAIAPEALDDPVMLDPLVVGMETAFNDLMNDVVELGGLLSD